MSTSGTFSFSPTLGSYFLSSFSRIGVKRTEITPQHLEDAAMESNFMQQAWLNDGLTLWSVDLQTVTLVTGQSVYSVPVNTVMVLDLYIDPQEPNSSTPRNRLILPFSRTDFASIANPKEEGFPTSFWFDRLITNPTITLWPVPDGNNTYTMYYYRYRNIQDAVPAQGGQPEIPYLWGDAYVAGLAHRLARSYAPALEAQRKADYDIAYGLAAKQGVENVSLYINPGLSGYFRN